MINFFCFITPSLRTMLEFLYVKNGLFSWSGKFYICQAKLREFQTPMTVACEMME